MPKMKLTVILLAFFTVNLLLWSTEVRNLDKPLKGDWNFQLEKVWEIDTIGEDILTQVNNIRIDEGGNIYLLENRLTKVFILDPSGKLQFSFGKQGEGPGEIKLPMGLFLKGDQIIVSDLGRFHYFSRTGQFIQTENPGMMVLPRAFLDAHRIIVVSEPTDDKKRTNDRLEIFDLKTKKRSTLAEISAAKDLTYTNSRMRLRMVDPLTAPTVVVGVDGNDILFGKNDRYQLKKIDLEGKELLSFSLQGREGKKISEATKRRRFENVIFNNAKMPKEMVDQLVKNVPDRATYFYNIWTDRQGLIFLFVSDLENQHGRQVDIFSPQGQYLYRGEIVLSDNYIIRSNLTIHNHTLCVFAEDDEGAVKLVKYKMKMPTI